MATVTLTKTKNDESVVVRARPYATEQVECVVDFSKTANQLAQNDIAEVIAVPADTFVESVRAEVLTVEGAARNFEVGDGADSDGYITSQSANTLAEFHTALALTEGTPNTITGFSNGKYYGSADTIDIKALTSGGLTACKIKVIASMRRYS